MVVRLFTLTALLLTLMALFFTITDTCANSNHTLLARGRVNANLIYPFYPTSQRERISNLPGRFQYASAEIPECENSFVIRADDPNAGRFAGRRAGGGRRVDICGNKRYGSGYPNATTEGVKGRDLPFFFHPISYGRYPGYGPSYIYYHEYGDPDNKHRPGGRLHYVTIRLAKSLVSGPHLKLPPMTLYAIADKPTLKAIKWPVISRCSEPHGNGWIGTEKVRISKPKKFKGPADDPDGPVPEQAVEYFRGSSVVLSLHGYNNTAQVIDYTAENRTGLVDTPLPSFASTSFIQCVNEAFRDYIPLVISTGPAPYQADAASPGATPQLRFVTLVELGLFILHMFF